MTTKASGSSTGKGGSTGKTSSKSKKSTKSKKSAKSAKSKKTKKATKYEMWITYNAEKQKIQLPVLPTTFQVTNGSNNESVNVVGLGEIVVMQSRPALQFSFSSFFPATTFPGLQVKKITKPITLIEKINKWKAGKKPVHFIVTGCKVDIYCTIENFTYYEAGGDPGTYQYSITLKEYREITIRKIKKKKKKKGKGKKVVAYAKKEKKRVNNTEQPKTYTVKSGDCLWNIAKKFYGSGSQYTKIYNANKKVIGSNPNLIYAGQVLSIP